jgi:hypothetical protein
VDVLEHAVAPWLPTSVPSQPQRHDRMLAASFQREKGAADNTFGTNGQLHAPDLFRHLAGSNFGR